MLVFRSLAIGLSAACFALLVMRPTVELRVVEVPAAMVSAVASSISPSMSSIAPSMSSSMPSSMSGDARLAHAAALPTIIDAAPGITAAQLAMTIRLQPGEQIVSLDDVAVTSDLSAGILLAARDLRARQYIDVGVDGPSGERRVLVLLH